MNKGVPGTANSSASGDPLFISVIIPTRDRAAYLERVLESLLGQAYSPDSFEIIVVDNGSTDSTPGVCETFSGRFPHFTYVFEERPGLHEARHRGVRLSRGGVLAFLDDDVETFPTWLEGIAAAFADPKVALVGGKVLPRYEAQPPWWVSGMWKPLEGGGRVMKYLSLFDPGESVRPMRFVFGCNFAVRKRVLLEARGFHPDSLPAEMLKYRGDGESWVSRYVHLSEYTGLYHPRASIYHIIPAGRLTVEYFCQRAYRQGISDSYTYLRYRLKKNSPRILFTRVKVFIVERLGLVRGFWSEPTAGFSWSAFAGGVRLFRLKKEFQRSYRRGFAFHRRMLKEDPRLEEWVLKETYMEPDTGEGSQ